MLTEQSSDTLSFFGPFFDNTMAIDDVTPESASGIVSKYPS